MDWTIVGEAVGGEEDVVVVDCARARVRQREKRQRRCVRMVRAILEVWSEDEAAEEFEVVVACAS
jgi:hypothetical protein